MAEWSVAGSAESGCSAKKGVTRQGHLTLGGRGHGGRRTMPAVRQGAGCTRVIFHSRGPVRVPAGGAAALLPESPVSRGAGLERSGCLRVVWAGLDRAGRRDTPAEAPRLGER